MATLGVPAAGDGVPHDPLRMRDAILNCALRGAGTIACSFSPNANVFGATYPTLAPRMIFNAVTTAPALLWDAGNSTALASALPWIAGLLPLDN